MTSNLKVILSAAGVAALLASPAVAKTARHQATPSQTAAHADGSASAAQAAPHTFVTPYGADLTQPARKPGAVNPDFQVPGNY